MTYSLVFAGTSNTVGAGGLNFTLPSADNKFPASFRYFTLSMWVENALLWNAMQLGFLNYTNSQPFSIVLDTSGKLTVTVNDGAHAGVTNEVTFNAISKAGNQTHLLLSVDTVGQVAQLYVNDAAVSQFSATWNYAALVTNPTPANAELLELNAGVHSGSQPCFGDVWLSSTSTFLDLTVTSNRRKFITAALQPVSLGGNGQAPTGAQPPIFLTIPSGGIAANFSLNYGTAGFATNDLPADLVICGEFPPINTNTPPPEFAIPLTPVPLGYKDVRVVLDTQWFTDGEWCVLQTAPMPVTVLAIIPEFEVGDDPEP